MLQDCFIRRLFWSQERLEKYWWERQTSQEGRDAYRSRLSGRFGKSPSMIADDFCTNRLLFGLLIVAKIAAVVALVTS